MSTELLSRALKRPVDEKPKEPQSDGSVYCDLFGAAVRSRTSFFIGHAQPLRVFPDVGR
jgi:hypothetical protein